MFSTPSKEPARIMVPVYGLLIDEEKTPALGRHIAPRLREGQLLAWVWQITL